jgi:hypothetical protein
MRPLSEPNRNRPVLIATRQTYARITGRLVGLAVSIPDAHAVHPEHASA